MHEKTKKKTKTNTTQGHVIPNNKNKLNVQIVIKYTKPCYDFVSCYL